MNRHLVLDHLRQTQEAVAAMIGEIEADPKYDYAEYWPAMQHIYHHLNTAWNARDTLSSDVHKSTDDDFSRWSQFPNDLPMMEL
jgi:hypothetical protein